MNNFNNIFTTYNSVDPPELYDSDQIYTEQEKQIKPYNQVLSELLDNVILKKEQKNNTDTTEKSQEDVPDNNFFTKKYVIDSPIDTTKLTGNKKNFINIMRPIYSKILKDKGLDQSYTDYLVAQSALESNWGKSQSGKFNLGGIKVPFKQRGKGLGTKRKTREVINGKDTYVEDEFRNFKDLEDYANYHINLLNNMNYQAFNGNFIDNVVRGGYATDPRYKAVLDNIYKQVHNT